MIFLTVHEVEAFFRGDATAKLYLEQLIEKSIREKAISLPKAGLETEYDHLKKSLLVHHETEKSFQLNFNVLAVSYALLEAAEKTLNEKLPQDTLAALSFADRFFKAIRQPQLNHHWHSGWENEFEGFVLIYLHQVHHVDVTEFMLNVTEEMRDQHVEVRSIDISYKHAFPYLSDSIEKCHATITTLLTARRTKDAGYECISGLCKLVSQKATSLYRYAKDNTGATISLYVSTLLTGLYPIDPELYLSEAKELYTLNQQDSLQALSWLPYSKPEHIEEAFDFISSINSTDPEYRRLLPTFYTRLIDNSNASPEIIKACFEKIRELTLDEDEQLRGSLVWRTGMINGFDQEKYDLLPSFMEWGGTPHFLGDYFNHFNSPHLLFELIKDAFSIHGIGVNMQLFESALYTQYYRNREAFDRELSDLLTDNLAIHRFAGIQIMLSRSGHAYEVDFLQLDEQKQIRVIETLLPLPIHIEELMPLILSLRNSPHETVRNKLTGELINLIQAYDKHLLDHVKKYLDEKQAVDRTILDTLENAYATYRIDLDEKLSINELNPVQNELEFMEQYYRLEHEKNTEMTEAAQSKSFFAHIGRTINVIRGAGFRTEESPGVSEMGKVEFSRLIDMRYYINPDKYEWNFKMNATRKNYE